MNDLSPWPNIHSCEHGALEVVDSLRMVFFLERDECNHFAAVMAAVGEFVSGIGLDALHAYVDEEGDTRPLTMDVSSFIEQKLGSIPDGEIIELRVLDHEQRGNVHALHYLHDPNIDSSVWPDEKSVISFRIGTARALEVGWEEIDMFVRRLTRVLPYVSGYVSPALAYQPFTSHAYQHIHRYIHRYPGFDVVDPPTVAWDIGDRLLGPYWINIVGRGASRVLGGVGGLQDMLGPEFEVAPCGRDGVIVKIGAVPGVGDINRGDDLPAYRKLAKVIAPILHDPSMQYLYDADGTVNRELQRAWHRRFLADSAVGAPGG